MNHERWTGSRGEAVEHSKLTPEFLEFINDTVRANLQKALNSKKSMCKGTGKPHMPSAVIFCATSGTYLRVTLDGIYYANDGNIENVNQGSHLLSRK
jgi:hypothetical protein